MIYIKIDEMLDKGTVQYRQDLAVTKKDLFAAVLETTKWQFEKCAMYRQLCKQKNFDPRRDLKSIDNFKDIPYITTANFKRQKGRPKDFLCVPESDIFFYALSSGTSGDPSMIGRSKLNMERGLKTYRAVLADLWHLPTYDWTMLFTPPIPHHTMEEKGPFTSSFFMFYLDIMCQIPPDQRVYLLKLSDPGAMSLNKRYAFDAEACLKFLRSKPKEKGKGWVSGSIPLLYGAMSQLSTQTGETWDLGENCVLGSGGGWKTFKGEEVPKQKFRDDMHKILGLKDENMHDVYSFTECDIIMSDCEYHNFHIPPWSDIIVRDFDTFQPVKTGEKGIMNIINPMAHSYAGVSIIQDDVVRVIKEDGCKCGRRGKIIEVIGRAQGAEAKGCGAQIAALTD